MRIMGKKKFRSKNYASNFFKIFLFYKKVNSKDIKSSKTECHLLPYLMLVINLFLSQ